MLKEIVNGIETIKMSGTDSPLVLTCNYEN